MLYNSGLSDKEVIENRKKYGNNSIESKNNDTFFKLFLESLSDPIIKILLIALGIKVVFLLKEFDWYETIGIVMAIFIASFISSISEYGSAKAFQRLMNEASRIKCLVKRNNSIVEINSNEVVYNDLVLLKSGDKVVADGIIIEGNVAVDEAIITGESKEVYKDKSNNKVFRETVITDGNGMMIVTKVGNNTFIGQIAKSIQEKGNPSVLKQRLTTLAKTISRIGCVGAFLVSFSYLFMVIVINNNFNLNIILDTVSNFPKLFGYILHALTLSVTIIVVTVPEGLPMMITLTLSSNMKKMLKDKVLVRKLVGIETSGNVNILFTDKTGTLTKGKLEVIGIRTSAKNNYYNLNEINCNLRDKILDNLLYNNGSYYEENLEKIVGGNITDKAILEFVGIKRNNGVNICNCLPFNSKNKYSITIIEKNKRRVKLIKGAPEIIIESCDKYYDEYGNLKTDFDKKKTLDDVLFLTKKGIRVIGLAMNEERLSLLSLKNSTFVGLVLIKDEIREETTLAIELMKNANIQVVMLTGDNKDTALAIAKEINLTEKNSAIITSADLNKMTDEEIKKVIPKLRVVARAMPEDKSKLVKISQDLDLVVGMTGDGVNDAVALKKADVGFAMGSGTEVAKEASDIVILDDNFLSITKAILYGRTIFKNIRKFIIFQLTVNLCAVIISIIGPFIGINTPITVIQMLWINMIMDTLAGLAFSYEPPLKEYMEESVKNKNEHIINKYMLNEILITGLYSTIICILFLKLSLIRNIYRSNQTLMTAFFGLFIFVSIFNSLNARTYRLNILSNLFRNRVFILIVLFIIAIQVFLIYNGGILFRTTGLGLRQFAIMILLAFTVVPFDLLRKIIFKHKKLDFKV